MRTSRVHVGVLAFASGCLLAACTTPPAHVGVKNVQTAPIVGLAALNTAQNAWISGLECPAPGSCVMTGTFQGRPTSDLFVASERHGQWAPTTPVTDSTFPRGAAVTQLVQGWAESDVNAITCPTVNYCLVGGSYNGRNYVPSTWGDPIPFLATIENGHVDRAIKVPGLARFGKRRVGYVWNVACSAPGNCAASGVITTSQQFGVNWPFLVREIHNTWGPVDVLRYNEGAINENDESTSSLVPDLFCPTASTCLALVALEPEPPELKTPAQRAGIVQWTSSGTSWRSVGALPFVTSPLTVDATSCSPEEHPTCTIAGTVSRSSSDDEVITMSYTGGHWTRPVTLRGSTVAARLQPDPVALSCPSATACSLVGTYTVPGHNSQSFIADEVRGQWTRAHAVAWSPATIIDEEAEPPTLDAVACSSPGMCVAGFSYGEQWGPNESALMAIERHGVWAPVELVPGQSNLGNEGWSDDVTNVACSPHGPCVLAGTYQTPDSYGSTATLSNGFVSTVTP